MTRRPARWDNHVTRRDFDVMATLFGFSGGEELKDFATRMQIKADNPLKKESTP